MKTLQYKSSVKKMRLTEVPWRGTIMNIKWQCPNPRVCVYFRFVVCSHTAMFSGFDF